MTTPTRLTELEAINIILAVIGESPVNTLTGTVTTDVSIARNILSEVNRQFQARGWHFNTEEDYELTPNSSTNQIPLSTNIVRVDTPRYEYNLTTRWSSEHNTLALYDITKQTFEFTNSVKGNVVFMYAFNELPEPAKWYITVRAACKFQKRVVGDETLYQFTKDDEMEALVLFEQFDSETADYNMLHDSDLLQSQLRS